MGCSDLTYEEIRIQFTFRRILLQFLNSLRPRQNGRLFADDTFKRIFLNENIRISTKNSLKFVPQCLINNIPALVLIMAWRRPGDKPLSEPMLVRSLTHICVTRPQWVKAILTNVPQDCFTGTGAILRLPLCSEITLRDEKLDYEHVIKPW